MRRLLRLFTLWLFALALPVHGALAAGGLGLTPTAPAHATMTMPDGHVMDAADMPCHGHAADKSGTCGGCCGPIVVQQALLTVAPTAARWAPCPRAAAEAARTSFLTGGTDRPPRLVLA